MNIRSRDDGVNDESKHYDGAAVDDENQLHTAKKIKLDYNHIVDDAAVAVSDENECSICCNQYVDELLLSSSLSSSSVVDLNRVQRVLNCSHGICTQCAIKFLEKNNKSVAVVDVVVVIAYQCDDITDDFDC